MKIVNKKLEELVPYENNPRDNEKAIDKVADSIKEFGFKVPLVIDKNNVIVTGHTRYKASQKLGLKEVPCLIADDLDEKQIKAFRLADNKVSDYSIWDNKKLLEELEELNFEIFTGFEISDIFEDIKDLTILDESNDEVINDNSNGVVYVVQFKTQNKDLIEKVKELVNEVL